MFKRMLSAFGVGGPAVDTVLDKASAQPGDVLHGRVSIQGGTSDATIDQVVLSLVTRVEAGGGAVGEFHRLVVQRDVKVTANQQLDIPFQLALPWETPVTAVGNAQLPGMTVGVRTELVIKGAPDKGDLDPVLVQPLPAQERVLEAFGELGATFRSADVEVGRIAGIPQELRFYQEIEFFPPPRFSGRFTQVELTFVTTHRDLWVILEADKVGKGRFHMTHEDAERADWAQKIDEWLTQAAERAPFGYQAQHHGHHGHHQQRGGGMGAMLGGAAAGVVGGMILGDMMDGGLFDEGGEEE